MVQIIYSAKLLINFYNPKQIIVTFVLSDKLTLILNIMKFRLFTSFAAVGIILVGYAVEVLRTEVIDEGILS